MKIGVVIGRFHVPEPHKGHQYLLETVKEQSDKVLIFLGVSHVDAHVKENPLTFSQRQHMLTRYWAQNYGNDLPMIMPLFDHADDTVWSMQLDTTLASLFPHDKVTLYGGRDSFSVHYKGINPVKLMSPVSVVEDVQGTQIRDGIIENTEYEFLSGQIFALARQFPKTHPTVDIAAMDDNAEKVLLIQRADNGAWGFPGGFVDPSDPCYEFAAARELQEELGLVCASPAVEAMEYIASLHINDWRYRGSRDQITTTFFRCFPMTQAIRANPDEVADYKWVGVHTELSQVIAPIHKPLAELLQKFC